MKPNKMIVKLLIGTGSIPFVIGVGLTLVKGNSIVPFMSLPVIFIGLAISYSSEDGLIYYKK